MSELLVPFDTDSREFTRGWEMGVVWQRTETERDFTMLLHPSNAEMVLRVAEYRGLSVVSRDVNDDWMEVTFS